MKLDLKKIWTLDNVTIKAVSAVDGPTFPADKDIVLSWCRSADAAEEYEAAFYEGDGCAMGQVTHVLDLKLEKNAELMRAEIELLRARADLDPEIIQARAEAD